MTELEALRLKVKTLEAQIQRMRRKPLSSRLRFRVMERDRFHCVYCGRGASDGVKLQVDHVVPRVDGGEDRPQNLVTACGDCNIGKTDLPIGHTKRLSQPRDVHRLQVYGPYPHRKRFKLVFVRDGRRVTRTFATEAEAQQVAAEWRGTSAGKQLPAPEKARQTLLTASNQSGRLDSNQRPPDPQS